MKRRIWDRSVRVVVLLAMLGIPALACENTSPVRSSLTGPTVTDFVVLARESVNLGEHTTVTGGNVGASGENLAAPTPTLTLGTDGLVDQTKLVVGQRVSLKPHALVGAVQADQLDASSGQFVSLSPYAPPPAVPAVGTVSPGTAAVTVGKKNQTMSLAAGAFGQVVVKGTLELSGGLYQFASLTLEEGAQLVADARAVVRIANGMDVANHTKIGPVAPLGAADLRFSVAGTVQASGPSVSIGTDADVTALILAAGAVTVKTHLTMKGAIAARSVEIGTKGMITFEGGFGCNADSTCADTSTCTSDSCTDGQCANAPLADGTTCSDGIACTQPDTCQGGICVGVEPTCSTPATCNPLGVCAVQPIANCVITQMDGSFIAMFGYKSGADVPVMADVGPGNQFSPGDPDRGQPTTFQPGELDFWVPVPFDGSPLTWTLGGAQATASMDSPACPPFPTGGDDDTGGSGELTKVVPLPNADTPDPNRTPKVASDNLFPLVTVPVVDFPEPPAMAASPEETAALVVPELGLPAQAATRYVEVVLVNSTSQTLSFVEGEFEGAAVLQPPSGIAGLSYGHWQSKNGKALQGTGGHMTYSFAGGTQVKVTWNNPFIGGNDFGSSLTGGSAGSFAVDRVGGGGNQATVFFILRNASDASTNCPFGTHQWMVDSLRGPNEPLTGFDTASGFVTTPLKNITEIGKWEGVGCFAPRVVGRVVARAHSTDRFFTIDIILDEFDGAFLTDSGKSVRIEVGPAGTFGLKTNPAHKAIVDNGMPALGSRIVVSGTVLIDHGSFLEVHPTDPIEAAPACNQIPPGQPVPLFCNPLLTDFFTWDSGQAPTPMGRAEDRACFLTGMSGAFQGAADEIHALIDPATNNWFLTGHADTSQQLLTIPGFFPTPPTPAEASAILGVEVTDVIGGLGGLFFALANVPHDLHASARCITTPGLSAEATWTQGDLPVKVGTQEDACFLTRVAGHFEGAGERVELFETINQGTGPLGPTVIEGSSQQAGVSASARCSLKARTIDFGFAWNQGDAAVPLEFIDVFPACYMTAVGGRFEGRGEQVQIRADTFNGRLFWELGGMSQQNSVFAFAQCMKP